MQTIEIEGQNYTYLEVVNLYGQVYADSVFNTEEKVERNTSIEVFEGLEDDDTIVKDEISQNEEWKIPFITDKGILIMLNKKEYQLYCALKTIAYREGVTEQYILFDDDMICTELSKRLELYGGLNKQGKKSVVDRKTISKTIKSLIEKDILSEKDYKTKDEINKTRKAYYIMRGRRFAMIKRGTMQKLVKCYNGDVIKVYALFKGMYDNEVSKGNVDSKGKLINPIKINRNIIAETIGHFNKEGKVTERMLRDISDYIDCISDKLIDICVDTRKINGKYESCYYFYEAYDKIKRTRRRRNNK